MGGERQGTGGRRGLWIGGAVAVVALGAGGWALTASGDPAPRTGPLTAAEIRGAADGFLDAWADGDAERAADRTDDVPAAAKALRDYRERGHLTPVHLTAGTPKGARVPFAVRARFSYEGGRAPVSYDSGLTVVRRAGDGEPVVAWRPAVLHPRLVDGARFEARETTPARVDALDRAGRRLDTRTFPSLAHVVDGLRGHGGSAGGRPGVELRTAPGGQVLASVPEGAPGRVRTTIDARVQKAAEREVALRSDASLVVVKPSTGEILAVAGSGAKGADTALRGRLAPGSTMKMITASLLLEKKLAAPDRPHPCPKNASYGGWTFHNVDDFDIVGGTFRSSFAASCNTAFITQAGKISDDALSRQARDVFGIGERWSAGVDVFAGAVPVEHAASKAASMIGQGEVRMNPLTMASVISTARTGQFRQPYLVAPDVGHRTPVTAHRPLDATAHAQLRDLLHTTATSGSASGSMAGLTGDIGAKTGSAEVIGQKKPNGWFAAWHGDMAAAAVMRRGGRGGESSGPLVAAVLKSAQ